MTENEVFEHISNLAGDYKCFDEKISHQESLILCNLIEEIQQYRAIGTVEEVRALKEKNNEHYSDTDELDGYGYTCTNKTCVERIRNKAIDEFYDEVLNFEDYIEPIGTSEFGAVLLYSGKDITNMICKIAEQLKAGGTDGDK